MPLLTNFARPANSSALLILKTLFSSLYQRVFSFLFQTEFWTKYFQVSSLSPYVNLAICSPIIDKSKPLTFILASLAFFIMFFLPFVIFILMFSNAWLVLVLTTYDSRGFSKNSNFSLSFFLQLVKQRSIIIIKLKMIFFFIIVLCPFSLIY